MIFIHIILFFYAPNFNLSEKEMRPVFGSQALETAIGMLLYFLLFSVVVTSATQVVYAVLRTRAKTLRQGLQTLFEGVDINVNTGTPAPLWNLIDEMPAVRGGLRTIDKTLDDAPSSSNRNRPSNIDPSRFVLQLLEKIDSVGDSATKHAEDAKAFLAYGTTQADQLLLRSGEIVDKLSDGPFKLELLRAIGRGKAAVDQAEQSSATLQRRANEIEKSLADWFDSRMSESSTWFRQRSMRWNFGIAFLLAVMFNANALDVAQSLWIDDDMRAAIIQDAEARLDAALEVGEPAGENAGDHPEPSSDQAASGTEAEQQSLEEAMTEYGTALDEMARIPMGWTGSRVDALLGPQICPTTDDVLCWERGRVFLGSFLGWLVTALAAVLGAPFWFDQLKKLMDLRSKLKMIATK